MSAWDVTFDKNATMAIVSYSSTNQTIRIFILTVIIIWLKISKSSDSILVFQYGCERIVSIPLVIKYFNVIYWCPQKVQVHFENSYASA